MSYNYQIENIVHYVETLHLSVLDIITNVDGIFQIINKYIFHYLRVEKGKIYDKKKEKKETSQIYKSWNVRFFKG